MGVRGRVLGSLAGVLGVAAAGTAVGIARQQREISRRAGSEIPFGSLRSEPITVVADDGVPLHVEVDEVAADSAGGFFRRHRSSRTAPVTVIFVHGYCLQMDCWHFQRAAYRDLVRTVYYDQRSHGRSGRSSRENANFEQLGRDLRAVIEATVPDGPVVLVGHSMGGMSIIALAEQFPELIGDQVVGIGLISTTAGGLDPGRMFLPMVPARLSAPFSHRAVSTLQRGHRGVDRLRRLGQAVATVAVDRIAFGREVPRGYVEFVDDMLSQTSFEVIADFFPHFAGLDKFDLIELFGQVPTSIICGTKDRLTSIGHARKLHSRIDGSRLLECEGAGHMVIMECHDLVNAELDQLVSAAAAVPSR
ncbi:alpha/beta fold hydrolase [Nocardioides sambongensis]|uniref:alpha/beta fold hydrolase n=1 Tax=Nocardioides sambongensis TaxID=2589074 RepID=UPI0011287FEE|nr:alpha/beta hydrolase [Nocardioides sambongensis]